MKNILAISSLICLAIGLAMAISKRNLLRPRNASTKQTKSIGVCADIKKYPYYVFVVKQEKDLEGVLQENSICEGSIIGSHWIITAFSCTFKLAFLQNNNVRTMYVKSDTANWKDKTTGHIHHIATSYYDTLSMFGVGLIRVKEPFQNANSIKIKLAATNYPEKMGSSCTALAYMKTSDCIKETVLKILNVEKCMKGRTILTPPVGNFTCTAVANNVDNQDCKMGPGGPVVQNGVLIGILNIEAPCKTEVASRMMFAKVSTFEGWLNTYQYMIGEKFGMEFVDN